MKKRKIVAVAIAGFFSFILITTAQDHQIKKPHHPCASLKDAYDGFAAFKVSNGNIQHDFKDIISDFSAGSFEASSLDFHGLSPPFGNNNPPYRSSNLSALSKSTPVVPAPLRLPINLFFS